MIRSIFRSAVVCGALICSVVLSPVAHAQQLTAKPQYGGHLAVGTIHLTISALTWDTADWNWKLNHDQGPYAGSMSFRVER
jgi:peptide/nickel transport system substrate-binding protein